MFGTSLFRKNKKYVCGVTSDARLFFRAFYGTKFDEWCSVLFALRAINVEQKFIQSAFNQNYAVWMQLIKLKAWLSLVYI